MRPLLAIALLALLTMTLAGCSGDPERYPNGIPSPTTSRSGTTTSPTTSTANPPNRAPTAVLNASVENGTAPLNVTFTLDGADADKDPLHWTLLFSDGNQTNGTSLPANMTRAFEAGNHSVVFQVSDGVLNATARVNVTVTVGGDVTVTGVPLVHQEGSSELPCPQCPVQYNVCPDPRLGDNGNMCFYFKVPPEAAGRMATFTNSGGPVSADFMSACSGGTGIDYFADEPSPHEVEVPKGTVCIIVYDSTNPGSDFIIDIL